MGNEESKTSTEKAVGLTVGYSSAVATVASGVGLLFTGPVGIVAGGILLSTGISSLTNTIEQNVSDKNDFSYSKWGIANGIGAASGAIAAPFAVVGGLASAGASAATKVATVVASEAVGGAVAQGSTNCIAKAADGKEVTWEDFGKGAVVGAIGGGIGAGCGQAASKVAGLVGKGAAGTVGREIGNKTVTVARIAIKAAIQAAGAAGGSALGKFIENVIENGDVTKKDFCSLFNEENNDIAEQIWKFLTDNQIIVNEKVANLNSNAWDRFPEDLTPQCKSEVRKFLDAACDLSRGVGQAAAQGAAMGAAMAAIGHMAERHQLQKQVKSGVRARANNIRAGADGGTNEIHAFVHDRKDTRVVVLTDEGRPMFYGSDKASHEILVHYDPKEKHYSPFDSRTGNKISIENKVPGDCLFEALAYKQKGVTATGIRQDIAASMDKKPVKVTKNVQLKDIATGGGMTGGGAKKNKDKNNPYRFKTKQAKEDAIRIMELYFEDVYAVDSNGKKTNVSSTDIRDAIHSIMEMPERRFKETFIINDNRQIQERTYNRVHTVQEGEIFSVSIFDPRVDSVKEGKLRATFKLNGKGQLKLHGLTKTHDYKNALCEFQSFEKRIHRVHGNFQLKKTE